VEKNDNMSNRLYVGNLAFHTTEGTLQQTFSSFGTVVEAKLVIDRESGRSRGFGFVSMSTSDEANAAIQELNGADLDGRALKVNIAEDRRPSGGGGAPRGGGGGDRGRSRGGDRW
jgi:RNA recognition motif-containing protein